MQVRTAQLRAKDAVTGGYLHELCLMSLCSACGGRIPEEEVSNPTPNPNPSPNAETMVCLH
jgi:hypothetical protein